MPYCFNAVGALKKQTCFDLDILYRFHKRPFLSNPFNAKVETKACAVVKGTAVCSEDHEVS